jgi:carbon-monoxide dehydrogenase medium subunit
MYAFDYHKPSSLDEVAKLLAEREDASLVAGGMTLVPTLKQRLAMPSDLIDLAGIADLKGVRRDGDTLIIGAMTTHGTVARDPTVSDAIPGLAALAGNIGDAQVRNRGTIGGSVANNDPAACYPAALVAMNGLVETNKRTLGAEEFFTGMFETALEPGEIVTAVHIPVPKRSAYAKFENPASRYAIVGVYVADSADGVRVAVTGAGENGVFRATAIEEALAGDFSPDAAKGVSMPAEGLNSDIHASAAFRAHLISVMASRAVAAAG